MSENTTKFDSNPAWVAGRITSNTKMYAIVVTCFAILWTLATIPAAYFAITKEIWIALVFPAAGVFVYLLAAHAWYQWVKFGPSEFVMEHTPAPIGGQAVGVVRLERHLPDEYEFHVTCSKVKQSRKRSSGVNEIYKSEALTVTAKSGSEGTEIPIRIAIPNDANETGRHKKSRFKFVTYDWHLHVQAKHCGFSGTYCIPVFAVSDAPTSSTAAEQYAGV